MKPTHKSQKGIDYRLRRSAPKVLGSAEYLGTLGTLDKY